MFKPKRTVGQNIFTAVRAGWGADFSDTPSPWNPVSTRTLGRFFGRESCFLSKTGGYSPVQETIADINSRITQCRLCPRLVEYRETVARNRKRQFADWEYWGRPVPGFGETNARLFVIGLAPAAHGGNRTGRIFTGDPSGRWLYRALFRAGFANQATSESKGDGMALRDCYISAVVHCAPPENRPLPGEIANCSCYFHGELRALESLRVVVVLGRLAFENYLRARRHVLGLPATKPRPVFMHGAEYELEKDLSLLVSYHPSQRNTSTRVLTEEMLDAVFGRARAILDEQQRAQE